MTTELQLIRAGALWPELIKCAINRKTITYQDLAEELEIHHRALRFALEVVQDHCLEHKYPPITSLVVNKRTGLPGAGNKVDPVALEAEQIRIFNYDWIKLDNPFQSSDTGKTHAWWLNNPNERYWVESTDRKDLGVNLIAPISSHAGQKLVSYVEDGDIVLHYYQPTKAIVAYSIARGNVKKSKLRWPDRDLSEEAPAYEIELVSYTELARPIDLAEIQGMFGQLKPIRDQLEAKHKPPLYFPWAIIKGISLNPAQGAYLSKLPKQAFDLFKEITNQIEFDIAPELIEIPRKPKESKQLKEPTLNVAPKPTAVGYQSDIEKKEAVEQYAMKIATEYLEKLKYEVHDVSKQLNIGYDLRAIKGEEVVGVEVKGSLSSRIAVDITVNELQYARQRTDDGNNYRTLLFVVDSIGLEKIEGKLIGVSGNSRKWWDWDPIDRALFATSFRYTLPADSSS